MFIRRPISATLFETLDDFLSREPNPHKFSKQTNTDRDLNSGGHLVLFGVVASPELRSVFAGTLLSAWGRSLSAGRLLGGSYSKDTLDRLLSDNAYNGLDFTISDSPYAEHCDTSLIIASASDASPKPTELPARLAIITDGVTSSQIEFADRLKEHIVTAGSEASQVEVYGFSEFVTSEDAQGRFCISLLEYEQPFLADINAEDFDRIKTALSITDAILWVTKDAKRSDSPEFHMVDGFSRSLRSENGTLKFVRLAITDADGSTKGGDGLDSVMTALRQANGSELDDMEFEYEEREGFLQIPRVVQTPDMNKIHAAKITPYQEQEVQVGDMPLQAVLKTPGIINSVAYEEMPADANGSVEADEILIEVRAVGINAQDYDIAMGKNSDEAIFSECSGIVRQVGSKSGFSVGDVVFARTPGACTTGLKCTAACAAPLPPSSLSMIEAAALPAAGVTAFHALVSLANLSDGETALIHHAAGAIGQLAVQVAQHRGARVIATVNTEEEFALLKDNYQIEPDCILSRRDTELPQKIAALTTDGVDVALNFEQGDDLDHCIEVLAPFGRLVNVGLASTVPSEHLVKEMAAKNITNSTFTLSSLQRHRPALFQKHLNSLASLISTQGIKSPTPLLALPAGNLDQALQQFQKGQQNMGKVVVDLAPKQSVMVSLPCKLASSHI